MNKICDRVRGIHSVKNIVLVHRLGAVPVKEASVLIACSGGHRQETLQSTEWLINELKSRVPIWKRETFSDGQSVWKENKEVFWKQYLPRTFSRRLHMWLHGVTHTHSTQFYLAAITSGTAESPGQMS